MSNVEETIKDRHGKYGSFQNWAEVCNELKRVTFKKGFNHNLNPIQKEALAMIFVKIARITTGNPSLVDNWHDIAGYARLVEIELQKNTVDVKSFGAIPDKED